MTIGVVHLLFIREYTLKTLREKRNWPVSFSRKMNEGSIEFKANNFEKFQSFKSSRQR